MPDTVNQRWRRALLFEAPLELRATAWFWLIVGVFQALVFAVDLLGFGTGFFPGGYFVPHWGWFWGFFYALMAYFFVWTAASARPWPSKFAARWRFAIVFAALAAFGAVVMQSKLPIGEPYKYPENPWLQYSSFRPYWEIALPLVWMVVFLSPRTGKYLEEWSASVAGHRKATVQQPSSD